jgi:hypothetical protein
MAGPIENREVRCAETTSGVEHRPSRRPAFGAQPLVWVKGTHDNRADLTNIGGSRFS